MPKTVGSGPLFEVRRDVDLGPRTLRRGQRLPLAEIERLAPGKAGALRRTGLIRPVGTSDRDELAYQREAHKERRRQANREGLKQMQGVTDES